MRNLNEIHVKPVIKMNMLDRFISAVAPQMGMRRMFYRAKSVMAMNWLSSSGYVTPGSSKNSMRGWLASSNQVDRDTIPALDGARAGSRDLFMNTPIATGVLKRVNTNAIGWGLTMQSRIDRELLKMTDEDADAWERNTEREFRMWAYSKDCDVRRTLNFQSMQGLALFSALLSGDVFILLPYVKREGQAYDLRLQVVEADFVANPNNRMETSTIAGGVEVDENGAPVAYYFRKTPRDFPITSLGSGFMTWAAEWERVEAFGAQSGRRNVLHLMRVDRPGQRRGMPLLTPVIERLKQLSRLSESELAAAVVTSFFTVFIKNSLPGTGGTGLADSFTPGEKVTDPTTREGDKNLMELGPGMVNELQANESIDIADPKRPNGAFAPFFDAIVKEIGSATEIPAEQIMLHFSSSYSAARSALLEAWKFYKVTRSWISTDLCQPVYEEWLAEAVGKGRIKAPGFFNDQALRCAWSGAAWTGPGQGQINPSDETDAALKRIGGCLSTYEDEHAAIHGTPWEGAAQRLSREVKLKEKLGLRAQDLTPQTTSVSSTSKSTQVDTTAEPKPKNGDKPGTDAVPTPPEGDDYAE